MTCKNEGIEIYLLNNRHISRHTEEVSTNKYSQLTNNNQQKQRSIAFYEVPCTFGVTERQCLSKNCLNAGYIIMFILDFRVLSIELICFLNYN